VLFIVQTQDEAELFIKWASFPSLGAWVPPLPPALADPQGYFFNPLDQGRSSCRTTLTILVTSEEWIRFTLPSALGRTECNVPKHINSEVRKVIPSLMSGKIIRLDRI
jgi:hypothetical protein